MLGMLVYGWSLETKQPIWVPLVGMWILGFGYTSSCIGATSYFVELVPNYASSVSAATSILRLGLATLFSSSGSVVIEYLGYGKGSTLYAAISLISILLTILLLLKGPAIRAKTGPH
ncbi:hypothetical protein DSO57_1009952 [Entomophthora muscae]|uniref:Uncharacterized protein n=1 Tax=Entomophthora muscae TaxID=34485 RepID=A0ACC2UGB1_9FUNG|nr:hypothetical protein DSO57_1009952 [Entomophthora muscae]